MKRVTGSENIKKSLYYVVFMHPLEKWRILGCCYGDGYLVFLLNFSEILFGYVLGLTNPKNENVVCPTLSFTLLGVAVIDLA